VSKARLVITAVVVEGRSQADVARAYGVSKGWVSKLVARYRAEGEAAFEPRSRRPKTLPTAITAETVELIVQLRKELSDQGLDAGPDTIAWHLKRHHQLTVSRATISRYLTRQVIRAPSCSFYGAFPGTQAADGLLVMITSRPPGQLYLVGDTGIEPVAAQIGRLLSTSLRRDRPSADPSRLGRRRSRVVRRRRRYGRPCRSAGWA
jgi:transposase